MTNKIQNYIGCKLYNLAKLIKVSAPSAKYQTPTMEQDGSVHYPPLKNCPPPPHINGYVRVKDNPWSFVPLWPECATRFATIHHQTVLGTFNITMRCNNPSSNFYTQNVSCYQCAACSSRVDFCDIRPDTTTIETQAAYRMFTVEKDGSILYTKEEGDWEPPKDIKGYQRDPENHWRFIPIIWPDCNARKFESFKQTNCGCLTTRVICNNPEHSEYKKDITISMCEDCPNRVLPQLYQIV